MMLAMPASFVTSCYDDTELRESISRLEERVLALEKQVAENIEALQSMISVGSIASWSYNAETGKGVITLLDGKTLQVNQSIKGYSIITIEKGDDGVYYWALCADGVNIPLLIDNKKVPVAVTPSLKISSDKMWMISVDGGKTWIETGISYFTGESAEDDGESDEPVVESVLFEKVEKDGDVLVLTLVGGEEVRVNIVGEAVFKAAADTLWFSRTNMEKSVAIEMSHVKAYTITEKPEGWKARIDDEAYLFVTTPENFTDYPQEGTVKVLAVFDNGSAPEIMCIEVVHEPYLSLSRANGVVSVKMSEHTSDDFTGYALVGWKSSEYTPENAVEWLNNNSTTIVPYQGSETYELEELIEGYSMLNEYVVFAAPYLPASQVVLGKIRYELSDLVSVTTLAASDTWNLMNLRFDSADLVSVLPVSEFYGGFSEAERWDAQSRDNMIELLAQDGGVVCNSVQYDGPVNGFPDGSMDVRTLLPATEYVLWYLPVKEGNVYAAEDFEEYRFTTPDIAADASVQAPAYVISDVTSSGFTAEVTPAASYYKTFAAPVKASAIAGMSEWDIVEHLIRINTFSEDTAVNTLSSALFSPEDEVYLMAVSINEEGGYSPLVKERVVLKALVYTEEIGVSVSGWECDEEGTVTLSLEFKGSPVNMTYLAASYTYYTPEMIQQFMALGQMGEATSVELSGLSDGKLVLEGLQNGVEYTFYAVVSDAAGRFSYITTYAFTPTISITYIMSDDPDYEFGMPQISGKLSMKKYTMTVNMPETCLRYWLFCGDHEYLNGDVFANTDKMVNMGLELSGETMHTESISVTYTNVQTYTRIYMVWQDTNGKYHAIYEFNPNKK